jgi:AmmeMemoRadiSam system protein A
MPVSSTTTSGSGGPASDPAPREGWTAGERAALVGIAHAALIAAANGALPEPPPTDVSPRLAAPAGAFVTLHVGTELRGCIGSVEPQGPVVALVARMAAAAATRDPRFPPLAPGELRGLRVEISVLSAPRAIDPAEIDPAIHGVGIRLDERRAVLLPQVAARHGWSRDTLLAELCAKAGLPADAWREPAAILVAFTAETIAAEL